MNHSPRIMDGPRDLWVPLGCEYKGGDALPHPVFARAAYRKDHRDRCAEFRERIADWLENFHPMDFYPVRVIVRAARFVDDVLFGAVERETTWATGVGLTAIIVALAVRMMMR